MKLARWCALLAPLVAAPLLAACTPEALDRDTARPGEEPVVVETPDPVRVSPRPPRQPTGGTVRPEDHGAVGDGVTDDSAALQDAVDFAAQTDARVVLGADTTYLMTGALELPSSTFITGQGSSSVLKFTWTVNDDVHDGFYVGNVDQKDRGNTDITLTRFAIRGAGTGYPAGPKDSARHPRVPAIRFRLVDRFVISQLDIGYAPAISIIHQGCSNGRIVQNRIHHSGRDGINSTWHRENMHDIVIAENTMNLIGDDGIAVIGAPGEQVNRSALPYNILVRDNKIRGWPTNPNGRLMGRGIAVLAATRVRIVDNLIDRTHSAGILIAPSTRAFSVDPRTGAPWRSADIQVTGNRIIEAGHNVVGSNAATIDTHHEGVIVKSSNRVVLWDNEVEDPFGTAVAFYDCRRCRHDEEG